MRVPERSSIRVISVVNKHFAPFRNCLEGSDGQAPQAKPRVMESDKDGVRLEAVVDFVSERCSVVVCVPVLTGQVHGVGGVRVPPVQVDHVVRDLALPRLPRLVEQAVVEADDGVAGDFSPGKQAISSSLTVNISRDMIVCRVQWRPTVSHQPTRTFRNKC